MIASIHGVLFKPLDTERHTQIWLRIAENPHIDVIGHCGETCYCFDFERVIKAFARHNKIVEINASSAVSRPTSQKNCALIAKLCEQYGVPMVLSSDAHFAPDIGSVDRAVALVKEVGIRETSILNANVKRLATC